MSQYDCDCKCSTGCTTITITVLVAITSLILIIYGLAAWNSKAVSTCFITDYEISWNECHAHYRVPESINCSKPSSAYVDESFCGMLDLYKYKGQVIRLPCLIPTNVDYKSCPDYISLRYAKPYFNYQSKLTEAQICTTVGGVTLGCICTVTLFYVLYVTYRNKKELAKLTTTYKSVNNYQSNDA